MADRLIIDSDETVELAHALAGRLGTTPGEAVARALRAFGGTASAGFTSVQQAEYEAIRSLARTAAASRLPGATSDHADLYGEDGLPR